MSEGLVTKVGRWLDTRWEGKATESELKALRDKVDARLQAIDVILSHVDTSDIKTRLEKVELYVGMTRKVDPTKPTVAKSAFSM